MDGWIERRLNGWVSGFFLNCDLWKILRVGMIGKEKLRRFENFFIGRV